ncbi:Gldg family protein [Pedobacter sp. MC2016-24]|uniref:Gldg family protein n=1 Tax=Pedobacter sp. MC2016-24 TaxID=2780090 RepID=UPI001880DD74|nr:Gldg family protein [Pedobacter sp. MC2016-24]MBE9601398.1 Gldg family protein [Pedobacter sp. MC2016-24]
MKIIFKIAKNELLNLFYSPVAWFLAVVFLIQCAYFYTSSLYPLTVFQDQLLLNNPKWKDFGGSLTSTIYLNPDGLFKNVYQNLYLFVPLLTMGLLGREVNNGTIKLLYSSPVKLREIVLGKYLAVMIYNLVLVGVVGIFIVSGVFNIKSIDIGLLLSAELGFYLLICAFSAIGLFMSGLTTYQIISGIGSFVLFFVLSRIGTLWQKYDFVRDLTYFLSISGRTEKMIGGLITTKDVIYFLIVIFMFLSFTLFKLKGERESRPWSVKASRYVGVLLVSVLLGYITSRPSLVGYWDTTDCKVNTVHARTQEILKKMGKEPIEVTLYANLLGLRLGPGLPESRNPYLSTLWDRYLRFKPDIKFKYVYYYDNDGRLDANSIYKTYPHKTEKEIAGIVAKMYQVDASKFIGPKEIRKQIDPYAENLSLFMGVKYKGKTIHLRTFNDSEFWPDQSQVAGAFKRLEEGSAPKIYFLTGNLERNIYKTGEREYSMQSLEKLNRTSLINMGFDVDTISLDWQNMPADAAALVIADPKTDLSTVCLAKIQQYIDRGGNLMVFGEPNKQTVINPVLKLLGVQLRQGILVQVSKNETPDKVISYGTDPSLQLAEERNLLGLLKKRQEKDTDDTLQISMPGTGAIEYVTNGAFAITPLMKTKDKNTWLKTGVLIVDSVPPVFNPAQGDIRDSSFTTAIQLTRQINQKQQRIIVCADADFKNNLRLGSDLFANAFYSWMNDNKYPVYIPDTPARDVKLNITSAGADVLKVVYVWVLPGVVLLIGVLLLIRRKRK